MVPSLNKSSVFAGLLFWPLFSLGVVAYLLASSIQAGRYAAAIGYVLAASFCIRDNFACRQFWVVEDIDGKFNKSYHARNSNKYQPSAHKVIF